MLLSAKTIRAFPPSRGRIGKRLIKPSVKLMTPAEKQIIENDLPHKQKRIKEAAMLTVGPDR